MLPRRSRCSRLTWRCLSTSASSLSRRQLIWPQFSARPAIRCSRKARRPPRPPRALVPVTTAWASARLSRLREPSERRSGWSSGERAGPRLRKRAS
eukprot:15452255-Alexandrium_andersonii.AAC.1